MEKKILYINKKDVDKVKGVHTLALLRKVKILSAPPEELRELPEDAELLKFIGFNSNEVGQFLQDMRKLGLKVDLKCMETEHNKDWSLKVLHKELMEEHVFMNGEQKE